MRTDRGLNTVKCIVLVSNITVFNFLYFAFMHHTTFLWLNWKPIVFVFTSRKLYFGSLEKTNAQFTIYGLLITDSTFYPFHKC